MSNGSKFLLGLIDSEDGLKDYFELNPRKEIFKSQTEQVLFGFVHNHVTKYHSLPSREALQFYVQSQEIPTPLPAKVGIKDTPHYYYDKLKERHLHLSLKGVALKLQESLNAGQITDGFEALCEAAIALKYEEAEDKLVNFSKSAHDIIKLEQIKKASAVQTNIRLGWPSLDNMAGGIGPGDFVTVVGRPACLSGDTNLYVSRKGKGSGRWYTLKELYRGFNGRTAKQGRGAKYWDLAIPTRVQSLMDDDLTGLNLVDDVIYSGVKKTYTLTTESGKQIRATKDHLFLTPEGFTRLDDLQEGFEIIVKADPVGKVSRGAKPYRKEVCTKLPYSPYPTRVINGCVYHRVLEHRAVYDASLNGLSLNDFIEVLKSHPDHGLIFSAPGAHIHHKDGNPANNRAGNLEALTNSDHGKAHAQETPVRKHFGQNHVASEVITSIEYFGEEETYDVSCREPYNNFIANGFVTHNSGKTWCLLYSALHTWAEQGKSPLFVSMEMNRLAIVERMAALSTSTAIKHIKLGTMDVSKEYKPMMSKLKSFKAKQDFWVVDGKLSVDVEALVALCHQLKPSVLFVDGAYMLRHPNRRLNRYERAAENAEWLKASVAEKLGIPVVISYQFNRSAVKKTKNDTGGALDNIGYTDVIGQISSLVLGMMQEEGIETVMEREIDILKGRNGECGKFKINWVFSPPNPMDFSEAPEKNMADLSYA